MPTTRHTERIHNAIARQMRGMGSARFAAGLKNEATGRARHLRGLSPDDLLRRIPTLAHANANDEHIWIKPDTADGLVLLDDLPWQTFSRLRRDGLPPACIVETSPGNFQAWIRLAQTQDATPEELHKFAAQILAGCYGGDPASASSSHYGRLAGFTNRKTKHRRADGQYPFVLCREASGRTAPAGQDILQDARQSALRRVAESPPPCPLPSALPVPAAESSTETAHARFREIWDVSFARYGDASGADFAGCVALMRQGHPPTIVAGTLRDCSPDLAERKRTHLDDYVSRTVRNAGAVLG